MVRTLPARSFPMPGRFSIWFGSWARSARGSGWSRTTRAALRYARTRNVLAPWISRRSAISSKICAISGFSITPQNFGLRIADCGLTKPPLFVFQSAIPNPKLLLPDHFEKLGFTQDLDAQPARLFNVAAGIAPGNHVSGFLGDGRSRAAAQFLDEIFDLGAAEPLQRTCDDEGLAVKFRLAGRFSLLCHSDSESPQLLDHLTAGPAVEELVNACGDDRAHAWDRGKTLLGSFEQRVDAAELLGEQPGIALAHVPDSQRRQDPCQATILARLDVCDQVLRRLFTHALELGEILDPQPVQ